MRLQMMMNTVLVRNAMPQTIHQLVVLKRQNVTVKLNLSCVERIIFLKLAMSLLIVKGQSAITRPIEIPVAFKKLRFAPHLLVLIYFHTKVMQVQHDAHHQNVRRQMIYTLVANRPMNCMDVQIMAKIYAIMKIAMVLETNV